MVQVASSERGRPVSHRIIARDGTAIAWHAYPVAPGRSDAADALRARGTVILTNGLGTTANFWTPLATALAAEHRVVHWDYRGHGESEVSRAKDYAIATQADDLARVTIAATEAAGRGGRGAEPAVHIAFSMGVTVLLELYRRRPDLVRAMVLIAGGADHPYASTPLFKVPGVRAAARTWLRLAAPLVPHLTPLTGPLSRSRVVFPIGRALGALGADAPRAELEHFFRAVGAMDPEAYWSSLRALLESRASDVLGTVSVPVLIVAPEHDVMAPQSDLLQLRRSIPGATWLDVPRTGHALLLEAADEVTAGVGGFLRGLQGGAREGG